MVKVRVCPFSKSFWAEQRRRTLVNYLISDILLQLLTKLTVFGLTSQPRKELVHCLFAFLLHLTEDVSLVRSVELWREVSIQCPYGNIVSACRVICIATIIDVCPQLLFTSRSPQLLFTSRSRPIHIS